MSKRFQRVFEALPDEIQILARRHFVLHKTDPSHSSLHFEPIGNGRFPSVRVG